eukprot:Partr_v1_DN34976_c0_g1_i1_m39782 putative BUD31 homolog
MPKLRPGAKPPAGWDLIEPTLNEIDAKLRDAEAAPHEGKRKSEAVWPIFRFHHQRTRYVYEMYHRKKAISKELFDFCVAQGVADGALIARWRKPGYEKLCCLRCVQTKDTAFGTACICRVPRKEQ